MPPIVGPAALCRLDDALIARIREGRSLRPVVVGALVTIVLGAMAYGASLGAWRAGEQALYSAIKLPLLLLGTAAATLGLNAMLALLLKARIGFTQTLVCVLLSLAVTSALLGALAPISMFLVANTPPPDPDALGLSYRDSYAAPSMEVAQALLLWHVTAVGIAGVIGVMRLHRLLARLIDDTTTTRRVLVCWLAAQGLVGSELSWLLRPFLGKPHLPPTFVRQEAFEGNFFEEIGRLFVGVFGEAGVPLGIAVVIVFVGWLGVLLRRDAVHASAEVTERGLVLDDGRHIAWARVARARVVPPSPFAVAHVYVELAPDAALDVEVLLLQGRGQGGAEALAEHIERHCRRVPEGPFRTPDTVA